MTSRTPFLPIPRRGPTVYGVLLNDPLTQERMKEAFLEDPYKQSPRAPVLYIKPINTHARSGSVVRVPATPGVVELGSTLGLVIDRTATRVSEESAMSYVAGCRVVCDLSLPHESVYRPAVRQRCGDQFLPMTGFLPLPGGLLNGDLEIATIVNGVEAHRRGIAALVRSPARLLADITAFMSLRAGDVVLLGLPDRTVTGKPADLVRVEATGLESLEFRLAAADERKGAIA